MNVKGWPVFLPESLSTVIKFDRSKKAYKAFHWRAGRDTDRVLIRQNVTVFHRFEIVSGGNNAAPTKFQQSFWRHNYTR